MKITKKSFLNILFLIVILMTGGCGSSTASANTPTNVNAVLPTTPTPIQATSPYSNTSNTVVSNKPALILTELINDAGEYSDCVGNTFYYKFNLPRIEGIQTEYINNLNKDMQAMYDYYIAPQYDSMASNNSLGYSNIHYLFTETENLYSLLIIAQSNWGIVDYYSYNFDAFGNELSNEDIFALTNYTAESFVSAVYQKLDNWTYMDDESREMFGAGDEYDRVRNATLSSENCNAFIPLYVNKFGRLGFIGRIYSLAGADHYDHCFLLTPSNGFCGDELAEMALNYYESHNGYRPEYSAWIPNEDGTISIQLYDNMGDHNSTSDWYTVDPVTATGSNIMEFPIDLTAW